MCHVRTGDVIVSAKDQQLARAQIVTLSDSHLVEVRPKPAVKDVPGRSRASGARDFGREVVADDAALVRRDVVETEKARWAISLFP
jgi:hypothetical protein